MKKPKKLLPKNRRISEVITLDESGIQHVQLAGNFEQNLMLFKNLFSNCSDIVFRDFTIQASSRNNRAVLLYIDGMVNKNKLEDEVLKNLMLEAAISGLNAAQGKNILEHIVEALLSVTEAKVSPDLAELADAILNGDAVLLLEGAQEAVIIGAKGWKSRAVEESTTEVALKGPRDGFTEDINVNTVLIRRRLKTTRLKFEKYSVGALTQTNVIIAYIKDIADEKVVEEVRNRISRINTDSILGSNYIEELIEDEPFTIFNQINDTERPDRVAAGLLEGQVAILVDTTPFVLLVPFTFPQLLQSAEDYYQRYTYASFIRLIRFFTLNIALLFPSLYVAVTTFHQEMLPSPLLYTLVSARQGVPFPAFVEAMIMEVAFEILREGGVRLPRPVGSAVSIVGAIVLGQATVAAGIVSPAMVIVVSTTAIASFAIPTVAGSNPIRMLRFFFIVAAATFGLVGIVMALIAVLIHLCSLRSFGVPFLSPVAPMTLSDLKDIFIRYPWWAMFTRPRLIGQKEPVRQDYLLKPNPSGTKEV